MRGEKCGLGMRLKASVRSQCAIIISTLNSISCGKTSILACSFCLGVLTASWFNYFSLPVYHFLFTTSCSFAPVDTTVPPVRLVGRATPSEGRVEIFINDQWGTVCDDYFTWYEGGVVCRQLNYTGIIRVAPRGEFGVGRGPIWLDNVYCPVGDESYITQCMHLEYGVHNCDHSEDVGVVCGEYVS